VFGGGESVPAPDREDVVPDAWALKLTTMPEESVTIPLMVTTVLLLSVAYVAGASTIIEAAKSTTESGSMRRSFFIHPLL
jgi:hypothetical protein